LKFGAVTLRLMAAWIVGVRAVALTSSLRRADAGDAEARVVGQPGEIVVKGNGGKGTVGESAACHSVGW
jgi:hypothetical protein